MKKGYVRFYRDFRDESDYPSNLKRRFTHFEARLDLYLEASGKDREVQFNGLLIPIERGQLITSVRELGKKWKWSKSLVHLFLKELENRGSIKCQIGHPLYKKPGHPFQLISITKYKELNPFPDKNMDTHKPEKRDTPWTPKLDTKLDTPPTEGKGPISKKKLDTKLDTQIGHLNKKRKDLVLNKGKTLRDRTNSPPKKKKKEKTQRQKDIEFLEQITAANNFGVVRTKSAQDAIDKRIKEIEERSATA